jgi:hypothetical protein
MPLQMARRALQPDARTYANVLNSIAARAAVSSYDNSARIRLLSEAQELLSVIEAGTIGASYSHHNAMLKVCHACVDVGGIEAAEALYERMPARTGLTYALMLQMTVRRGKCSQKGCGGTAGRE